MVVVKEISVRNYEKVVEIVDDTSNLHGFIAVHNTSLGPALGGVRMYPYSTPQQALDDVLRLAQSMTYKSALAEIGLGGGKSVIIGDPHFQKTEELLLAMGEAIDHLKGLYIAAEDVGTSPEDMTIIRKKTHYVVALPVERGSGDPSLFTAHGIYRGMQAVAKKLWGNPSLKKRRIAIQGLGHVGSKLAGFLFWDGADLILADIDPDLTYHYQRMYGAKVVSPEEILQAECDILSPCALGGIINSKTIQKLKCSAIAGSANNQLSHEDLGLQLRQKGILYAPDYVINSGGIINAVTEVNPGSYDPKAVRDKTDHISDRLLNIFVKADKEDKATNQVAEELAIYNLQHHIAQRHNKVTL